MDEATAKALKALNEQLSLVGAGIAAVIEPATTDVVDPVVAEVDDVAAAVDTIVADAKADAEFARKGSDNARLDRLEQILVKAFSTPAGRVVPRTTGSTSDAKKRVL